MTHKAEQVLVAFAGKVTGLTTTGVNVQRSRVFPQDAAALPSLSVLMGVDSPTSDNDENAVLSHIDSTLSIYVDIYVQDKTLDTVLNLIRNEISVAIQADYKLGLSFVLNTIESETEEPELVVGNIRALSARMNWLVTYRRSRSDPGA
jgi:hypothetical protein